MSIPNSLVVSTCCFLQILFCCCCFAGKTNQKGQILYGRSIRHRDVSVCPFGGMAFYLGLRFATTSEFEGYELEDWKNKPEWFPMKLLVDYSNISNDRTIPMKNDTYAKAIKTVLQELGIKSSHWVHLGHVTGPKKLEMEQISPDDIRILGNWDPKIQEKSYSTKLPMRPMRAMAGYTLANGMYYNPRSAVKVEMALLCKTPFKFAFDSCDILLDYVAANNGEGSTALHFCRFMKNLAVVFVQDAAAMWLLHEGRRNHPLFKMDLFQSDEWKVHFCFFVYFWFFVCVCSSCL